MEAIMGKIQELDWIRVSENFQRVGCGNSWSINLKETESRRILYIQITKNQALDIITGYQQNKLPHPLPQTFVEVGNGKKSSIYQMSDLCGNRFPRPLPHDLMKTVLIDSCGLEAIRIHITRLVDGLYHATIFLWDNWGNKELLVDSRPSDAIGLAVRCDNVPIYVKRKLFDQQSISFDQQSISFIKGGSDQDMDEIKFLLCQLDLAVKDEAFERAAQIRDEVARLRQDVEQTH